MIDVPKVCFTPHLSRHVECQDVEVGGSSVREVLNAVFAVNEKARGYVLDDQGALRNHMVVFVDGRAIADRVTLTDPVKQNGEVYVMQALSGG